MTHTERLRPPILWWLVVGLIGATFVIAVAVFLPGWGVLVSLVVAVLVMAALMAAFTGTTRVSDAGLRVSRSLLEWPYVGSVTTLGSDQVRRRMGPDADPRAFVAYRSFAQEAVEVTVDDPADPHPYWLISSHDAKRLAEAIESGKLAATGAAPRSVG